MEKFNGFPSSYAPRYCRFIENTFDVYNGSGRWWFIPDNYFTHSDSDSRGPVNEAVGNGNTFCYPMAQNGTVDYTQLDEDGDTVSNALTSTYRTPETALSGKTFKVADAEQDDILATFSFDDTAAEQAEEKPVRPVLRARMLRSVVAVSYTHLDVYKRQEFALPKDKKHAPDNCPGRVLSEFTRCRGSRSRRRSRRAGTKSPRSS